MEAFLSDLKEAVQISSFASTLAPDGMVNGCSVA